MDLHQDDDVLDVTTTAPHKSILSERVETAQQQQGVARMYVRRTAGST